MVNNTSKLGGVNKYSGHSGFRPVANGCKYVGRVAFTFPNDKVNKEIEVTGFTDYFPFGSPMGVGGISGDERKYVSGNGYRFGYQGQFAEDETEETGFNAFEARLYDARIGRWTTIDPAGQFYSPYLGMGNNPIMVIDKDGEVAWILIGAAAGGIINAGALLVTGDVTFEQLGSGDGTAWGKFGTAFVLGAGTGAIVAATGGAALATLAPGQAILITATTSAVVNTIEDIGTQAAINQIDGSYPNLSGKSLGINALSGTIGGMIPIPGVSHTADLGVNWFLRHVTTPKPEYETSFEVGPIFPGNTSVEEMERFMELEY